MCSPGGFVLFILSVSFLLNLLHIPRVVVNADSSNSSSGSNTDKVGRHIDITRKRSVQLNGIEIDENSLLNHLEDHERELIFGKEKTKREVKLVHLRQRTDAATQAIRNEKQQKHQHQRVKRSDTASSAAAAANVQSGAQRPTQEVSVQIHDDNGDRLANLHLRPTPKLIDDAFILIRRYANSTQLIEDSNELAQKYANCFFSNENSALDLCDDENMRGILHHNSTDYIIHPLPPRFGKSTHIIVAKNNDLTSTPTDLFQTPEYSRLDENIQFEPEEEDFNDINTTEFVSKRPTRNINYNEEQHKSDYSSNTFSNLSTTISNQHKSMLPPASYDHIQHSYRPRYQYEKNRKHQRQNEHTQHKRKHRRYHHGPHSVPQPHSHNERDLHSPTRNHNHHKTHRRKRRHISSGSQWEIPRELHIETAIFVDKDLFKHMAKNFPDNTESHVIRFVLAMINGVQLLYHHPSLGHRVNFVLKRLEILYTDPEGLRRDSDIDTYLSNFCMWQKSLNPPSDADKNHFDHAVILTGLDLYVINNNGKNISQVVGLAPVAGMCHTTSSCTINEGKHFESVFVVAHEIGHNLGMRHDGNEKNCDPHAYIMSPTLGSGKITWSNCSRDYLNTFLDTNQAMCLFDRGQFLHNLDHSAEGMLPGERFDADQQCMLKFGKNTVRARRQIKSDICRDLHCQRERWTWTSHPALEGTECGESMWCRSGVCVSRPNHQSAAYTEPKQLQNIAKLSYDKTGFLDGGPTKMGHPLHENNYNKFPGWGDWSDVSACDSGCLYGPSKRLLEGSSGLRIYTRSCLDFRRRCHGRDRKYESCIAKNCYSRAINTTTIAEFATQICERAQKFDTELTGEGLQIVGDIEESCKIFCKTKTNGTKSRSWTFPDGTTCRSKQYNLDDTAYCITGRCERFSCENTTNNYYKIDAQSYECRQQLPTPTAAVAAQSTEQNIRRYHSNNFINRQPQYPYNRYAERDNNYINREVTFNGRPTVRNKYENEVALRNYHGTQQDQSYRRKSDQYQTWNKYNYQLSEQRPLSAPPPTQAAPVSASLIAATAPEPEWTVKSGCHSSCMAKSKGIQVVTSRRTGVNNIQLCTHKVKPCERLQTPTEHAENTCARYKLKVRGLSGHGTQIAASMEEPDRSCRVGCQDEFIKYRFYLVNGRYGHFPLGTKCSNTEERYCVNGKCLEFGPNNIPLQQSHISLALFRKRRSLTAQRGIVESEKNSNELSGEKSQSRRKRSYLYYDPVNITETITQDFLNTIIQGIIDFEQQHIYDKLAALEKDHIEFNNPIHVMTDELKTQ